MDLERSYLLLHPRPVVLIVAKKGDKVNLMPASWVTPVSEEPPMIAVAIAKENYTHDMIAETKEFTVNVVGKEHVELVWKTGTISGREVDKVKELKIDLKPSAKVSAPRLADALGVIECRVVESVEAGESTLFIAEVVHAEAVDAFNEKYGWDIRRAKPLLHCSGRAFTVPDGLLLAR